MKVWELMLTIKSPVLFKVRLRRLSGVQHAANYISISLKPEENVLYDETNLILQKKNTLFTF